MNVIEKDQREKRRWVPSAVRAAVAQRLGCAPSDDHWPVECHWCGKPGTLIWWALRPRQKIGDLALSHGMEWDHVIPLARGGTTHADNVVIACRRCNRSRRCQLIEEWVRE